MSNIGMLIKPASSLCNMRCTYCFYADVVSNRSTKCYGIMSPDTQKLLIQKAFDSADEFCSFAFQGGEPTLAGIDFYKRQIFLETQYNKRSIPVAHSIQTNGLAIDDEWAKFLSENNFLVGISLDGPKKIHDSLRIDTAGNGTFDRVMNAISLLERYGVEYNILTVVSKKVAIYPKEVYTFFKEYNFKYIQFIECLDPFDGNTGEYSLTPEVYCRFLKRIFDEYYNDFRRGNYVSIRSFDNYVNMLRGIPPEACGMNGMCNPYPLIEANGNIYPCDFYVIDKYLVGNIHTHGLNIVNSSDIAKNFALDSAYIAPECRRCKWYKLCRGGCRRCREPFANGKPSLNKFCSAYKEFFEYAYPRMELMVRLLDK